MSGFGSWREFSRALLFRDSKARVVKALVLGARYLNFRDITRRRLSFRDKPNVQYCTCTKSIRTSLNQKENEKIKLFTTQRESLVPFYYKNAVQSYSLLPSI